MHKGRGRGRGKCVKQHSLLSLSSGKVIMNPGKEREERRKEGGLCSHRTNGEIKLQLEAAGCFFSEEVFGGGGGGNLCVSRSLSSSSNSFQLSPCRKSENGRDETEKNTGAGLPVFNLLEAKVAESGPLGGIRSSTFITHI